MLVAEVRWVASDSSPDFPGLSLAAANCKEFMQVVHEQTKNPGMPPFSVPRVMKGWVGKKVTIVGSRSAAVAEGAQRP
jgi:hypothetical protein